MINHIKKINRKPKPIMNKNKKNNEDKDKIDLNLIGIKNKLLLKLNFLKLQKKCFPNLIQKSLKLS